ncbi:Protein of unknown function [Pyronema omphalodes CBS 100304]|uniref:Uncharacterized protein n=1 Tax=Pyronema omphalodes (strain CBS 100304) TaxID=1076935 RepID=U4LJR4_PYROM|nr:Protein of unknown function [Pyronema omphalodes CBS 100304]
MLWKQEFQNNGFGMAFN